MGTEMIEILETTAIAVFGFLIKKYGVSQQVGR